MSTLARPRTPRRPNSVRAPRLSHTIDDVTMAPDSTVLNGYTLTFGLMTASWPMKHSSPTTVPSSTRTWARRSVLRPITQPRRLAPGPTYTWSWQMARSRKASAFTITSVPSTVYGAQVRAGFDAAVVADHDGLVDARLGAELDVGADPATVAELETVDTDLHPPVEHVGVRPAVRLERADVLPVALGDVAVQGVAVVEQLGEHVAREVDHLAVGDVVEHRRLEHVDARVDGVGEHLAPRRLLEEPLDGAVGLGDDDAELERVLDVLERDRRRRAGVAVRLHERGEVDVGEHVTRDHEERVVELVDGVADRPRGAERRILGRVPHGHAEVGAVAEVVADLVGEERHGHHDVVVAVLREQVDDVLHHRLVDQRHHRLRGVAGERAQPGALTAGEDDGLHDTLPDAVRGPRPSRSASRAIGT